MIKKIKNYWKSIPPRGQSLVEMAIFFPIIIMMLSGLIEFGFLLNYYLNLMDGPREGARFGADLAPFTGTGTDFNDDFYDHPRTAAENYPGIVQIVEEAIKPYLISDANGDDVVITVVAMRPGGVVFNTYPDSTGKCSFTGSTNCFCRWGNRTSKFSITDIDTLMADSDNADKGGALIVELYYNYHQELALPWLTIFVPDPIELHMYTVSPLPGATPPNCSLDPTLPECTTP